MYKVLVISNSCWNIFHYRKPLILKLLNEKFKVHIIANKDDYSKKLEDLGCNMENINFNRNSWSPIENLILIINYYKCIKKIKPDLLIVFTLKPNLFVNFSQLFFKTTIINNVTGLGTLALKSIFFNFLFSLLLKFSFFKSKRVIFHNHNDLKFLNLSTNNKFIVLPSMGINTSSYPFKKRKFNFSSNKIKFVFVGRLIKDKGIVEYLEAAKIINKKYPNTSFTVLGSIDLSNLSHINSDYINEHKKFKFLNFISFVENTYEIIDKHDCLILPSYREGIPRVIMEAQSMGIPVLATNVPGCNSLIKANINGFLFKERDVKSLVNIIEKFINSDINILNKISNNAYINISTNFEEKIILDRYMKVINNL